MGTGKTGVVMRILIEKIQNLRGLYISQARMLLSAEEKILDGLEKMQRAATDTQLQDAFQSHRQESEIHVARLESILNHTTGKADEGKCKVIESLARECDDAVQECDGTLRDVALIATAQRIEHFEIASYGTLRNFAQVLELTGEAEAIEQTLREEEHADKLLTEIADRLNRAAAKLP
jgi:ferritin-like metal-binding protein YciE